MLDNKITIRQSESGDEADLKRLWYEVFGDTEKFVNTFFDMLYFPGAACLAVSGNKVVGAGYCLPGIVALGKKCSYIYAVATYPEYRGKGIAAMVVRSLTARAFSEGAELVAVLPASESLTGWYERVLGMKPTFQKGSAGATFPASWYRFAEIFKPTDSGAPKQLWAVGAPHINLSNFRDVGWEFTFE